MTKSDLPRLAQARVHFIGIGGIGMCGLAELLHNMGARVTGSDESENAQVLRLEELGIPVFRGHHASQLGSADVVVYSSAVRVDNEEYAEARRRKIPLIRRAEALAEMMRLKRGVAIAGTHGKTTTTSLTASIFLSAHRDPTIVVGGRLDVIKSTAQLGGGEWLIAEADESDGSFLKLSPEVVVITNVDNDHLDHFESMKALRAAFLEFALRIPFYGAAIVCGDDPETKKIFSTFPKKIIFYGEKDSNDIILRAVDGRYRMTLADEVLGEFTLPLPGRHNALNAVAAVLAAREAGIAMSDSLAAVAAFRGVDRRFQHKATIRGMEFFDDYGHHPTEVEAVLRGCREKFGGRRLVVVFQPHRYSRTQICWEQFRRCFELADRLFLLDVYAAGERPIAGVDSRQLARAMNQQGVSYLDREEDPALDTVAAELREGDVIVTLGAGDVWRLGERMMEKLAKS